MATVSLEREIVLSYEAGEKLKKIMNEPIKYKREKSSDTMKEIEEGTKLLTQLFSRVEFNYVLK